MSAKLATPASGVRKLPSPKAKKDDKKKGKVEPEIVVPIIIPLTFLQQPTPFDSISNDSFFTQTWSEQRSQLANILSLTDSMLGYSTCDSIRLDLTYELVMFTRSIGLNGAQTCLVYMLQNLLIDTQDQSKDWLNERMRLILSTHCSELLAGTEHVDTDHLLPSPHWDIPQSTETAVPVLVSPSSKEKTIPVKSSSSPRPVSRNAKKEVIEEPVVAPEPPPPAPRPANMTWQQIAQVYNWLHERVMGRLELVRFALQAKKQTNSSLEMVWRMKRYQQRSSDFHPLDSAIEETAIEQPVPVSESVIASPKGSSGSSFPVINKFELPLPTHAADLPPEEHAILIEKHSLMQKQLDQIRQHTVTTSSATG